MSTTPIADYALLSDRHSAALVSRDGSVDWLCFPRFDSPSIFARLLGEGAGHWSVRAAGTQQVTRRYLDRTMVLETTCRTPTGIVVLVDALAMGENNKGHELGRDAPHLLLRQARCTEGEVEIELEYAPRPEYGLVYPLLEAVDGGLTAIGGADVLVLSGPVALALDRSSASGRLRLRRGEDAGFALHHSKQAEGGTARVWSQPEIAERLAGTLSAWESWSDLHQDYTGPWHDLVHHSGRVLQALSFQPTGAICAAATTSLPETVGGARNWDYRYTWVRDASFTIEALWVAACPDEANQFFEYITNSAAGSLERGADLQIMFGVGGERDLTERELTGLTGWRGSLPVRVGNAAWSQRQLDVYGELLNAVFRLSDHLFDEVSRRVGPLSAPDKWGAPPDLTPATKRFLVELADAASSRWQDKDQGIWEIRSEPRDFLYSKVMCWVALDRAVALAGPLGAADRVEAWQHTKGEIHEAVVTKGWSERANAFTQSFGSDDLDASNLLLPAVGFLPPDDPKVLATIDATEQRLTDKRGLVYRYHSHDGLEGEEGTFLLCTFWLAQALALSGQPARARTVFERAAAFVNDIGLLAEEVDPTSGELLGNFPQAFSHIGLVNAAWAIFEAEGGEIHPLRSHLGTDATQHSALAPMATEYPRKWQESPGLFTQSARHGYWSWGTRSPPTTAPTSDLHVGTGGDTDGVFHFPWPAT
jgi:alpha,alpha-trehalase